MKKLINTYCSYLFLFETKINKDKKKSGKSFDLNVNSLRLNGEGYSVIKRMSSENFNEECII